jgi:hypothetical protein
VIDAALLEKLKTYDTPTICNALEIVDPGRRLTGFTVKPLVCPVPAAAADRRLRQDGDHPHHACARARCQEGARAAHRLLRVLCEQAGAVIIVIQDLDGADVGFGAFWGEVQERRAQGARAARRGHRRLHPRYRPVGTGLPGAGGSVMPSHAHVHLHDFGKEVRVAGMLARSGDLVHADRHGAVTIPEGVAAKIPAACDLLARKEAVILEMARAPGFNVAKLREALAKQDEIH